MEDRKALVIDSGSYGTKVGVAGEFLPRSIFPSVVGLRRSCGTIGLGQKDMYVGFEVAPRKAELSAIVEPIENGIITNWDYIERMWNFSFSDELSVNPEG